MAWLIKSSTKGWSLFRIPSDQTNLPHLSCFVVHTTNPSSTFSTTPHWSQITCTRCTWWHDTVRHKSESDSEGIQRPHVKLHEMSKGRKWWFLFNPLLHLELSRKRGCRVIGLCAPVYEELWVDNVESFATTYINRRLHEGTWEDLVINSVNSDGNLTQQSPNTENLCKSISRNWISLSVFPALQL